MYIDRSLRLPFIHTTVQKEDMSSLSVFSPLLRGVFQIKSYPKPHRCCSGLSYTVLRHFWRSGLSVSSSGRRSMSSQTDKVRWYGVDTLLATLQHGDGTLFGFAMQVVAICIQFHLDKDLLLFVTEQECSSWPVQNLSN